jgi:hypothetical protein
MPTYTELYHTVVIEIPGTNYKTYCFIEDTPMCDQEYIYQRALRLSFQPHGVPNPIIIDGKTYEVGRRLSGGCYLKKKKAG